MPILKVSKICPNKECTGCMACQSVCPHNAIQFIPDIEGFQHPVITPELCIGCQLCIKVCPANNPTQKNKPQRVFSGWNKDETIRLSSSSGGVFYEIAKTILSQGGVVFGCYMNNRNEAEHTFIETLDDLKALQGSKYVQSIIGNSYTKAKEFLCSGRQVLFSGTPCQIAGLINFLRKPYQNLVTIDIACHGVPSSKIFNDYMLYLKERFSFKDIKHIRFREKNFSWIFYNIEIRDSANRQYIGKYYDDPYIRGFLRDFFLRPSCHTCQYSTINRVSDITLADWWGYKPLNRKDFDSLQKGVSLIMPSTDKGIELINKCNLNLRERSFDEALKTNRCFSSSYPPAQNRDQFWIDYSSMSFQQIIDKYLFPERLSLINRLQYNFPGSYFVNILVRIKYKLKSIFKNEKR